MSWKKRIVVDPKVLLGKPVIKGTRLSVEFIVGLLAKGWPVEEILENYPGITKKRRAGMPGDRQQRGAGVGASGARPFHKATSCAIR